MEPEGGKEEKSRGGKKLGREREATGKVQKETRQREKKGDKDGARGPRSRKRRESPCNEPQFHPCFTFRPSVATPPAALAEAARGAEGGWRVSPPRPRGCAAPSRPPRPSPRVGTLRARAAGNTSAAGCHSGNLTGLIPRDGLTLAVTHTPKDYNPIYAHYSQN